MRKQQVNSFTTSPIAATGQIQDGDELIRAERVNTDPSSTLVL